MFKSRDSYKNATRNATVFIVMNNLWIAKANEKKYASDSKCVLYMEIDVDMWMIISSESYELLTAANAHDAIERR